MEQIFFCLFDMNGAEIGGKGSQGAWTVPTLQMEWPIKKMKKSMNKQGEETLEKKCRYW
jgi:hypothetical protein